MAAAFLIKQRFSCFIQPTSGANPDDAATIKSAPGRELWPSRFAFTAPRWLPDADLMALQCAGEKKPHELDAAGLITRYAPRCRAACFAPCLAVSHGALTTFGTA